MDPAPKTLIDIARVSRSVLDTLVKYGGGKTVESFQLEKIVVASGAIVETLNKALLLGRGAVDARLSDWLAGEEPKTCLDVLNRMDALLRPKLNHGRGMESLFQSSRRSASTQDRRNEAIKLLWKHESYFHFLLSTEVWNHEHDTRQNLIKAPMPDMFCAHKPGTKLDSERVTQNEAEELPGVLKGGIWPMHTAAQDKKTAKHAFNAKKVDSVVRWLGAWSCRDIHERTLLLRQPDTCAWLPNMNMYKTWRNAESSFLWLHGKPGAGKSVLAASVIDNLGRSLQHGEVLAYFYCDFRNERSTNASEVMRSLLSQLLKQLRQHTADRGDLIDELTKQKNERPSANVRNFARYVSRVAQYLDRQPFLVLDALDECDDVEELLGALEELNAEGGIRLFVTSRPLQVIKERFQGFPSINMDMMNYETATDIKLHVTRELDSHRRLRILDGHLKNEIHSVLCKKANGMFRWVQCQLNLVKQCITAMQIRETLNDLPGSLNETYDRILLKISKDERHNKVARRALDWLVVALEPLQLAQIMEGLSIDLVGKTLDRESAPVHGPALLDVLSSLVSYNEVTDIVILSHFSVKEYLTAESTRARPSAHHVDEQAAHTQLALLCMCYIGIFLAKDQRSGSYEVSSGKNNKSRRQVDDSIKCSRSQPPSPDFHFLDEYAVLWGFRHLAYINPRNRVVLRAIEILHSSAQQHPLEWNKLRRRFHLIGDPLPTLEDDFVLYLLIAFAPEPLLRLFLGHAELKPKDGTNPLIYAAHFGKIDHAKTLLLWGVKLTRRGSHLNGPGQLFPLEVAVACSGSNFNGECLLPEQAAIDRSRCGMIDLFLAEGSPVPREIFVSALKLDYCRVPARILARLVQTDQFAEWAIDCEDEELLLRALDPARYEFVSFESPSEGEFDTIEQRIIQLGHDPSTRFNEMSLRHAVSAGHVSTVQHMISLNTLFPPDIILDAARSTASSVEIIHLCLSMGADVHAVSPTGDTPLHLALASLHYRTQESEDHLLEKIEAFIEAGCSPSSCNLTGKTPLHLALVHDYISTAKYLLSLSISLPPDILLAALESFAREPSVTQLLIIEGANVHTVAANGDTALHRALDAHFLSTSGNDWEKFLDYAKLLTDAGCNPSILNADGKTPFVLAAANGMTLVVQYLHGMLNIPIPSDILLSVVGSRSLRKASTIKFLINKGADIHATLPNGDTLLHLSMSSFLETDCLNEAKFLINAGCDPRARNLSGETPFHIAAREGFTLVMEYLLSLGVVSVPSDIMITQLEGKPLYAYGRHRLTVIRFLLDVGGNVHTVAKNGDTLLHLAAKLEAEEDALELVKHLVHVGCIPYAFNSLQETPLHVSARSGFTSVIKYLLSLDIPLPRDILLAASIGPSSKTQLIRYLVQEGVDIFITKKNKDTPLHLLLVEGEDDDRLECIKILIGAGCDPRAENLAGETPVHSAARRSSSRILEYLLSQDVPLPHDILLSTSTATTFRFLLGRGLDLRGVSANRVTMLVCRVLDSLCERNFNDTVELAKILISSGWEPSSTGSDGETIIRTAAKNGNIDAVQFFLSQNVPLPFDVLLSAATSITMDWPRWVHAVALTNFLIREGASVNVTASNGDTPLHRALSCDYKRRTFIPGEFWEMVQIFLNHGSDPSARNMDGQTPFDLAEAKGRFFNENFLRLVRNSRTHHLHS